MKRLLLVFKKVINNFGFYRWLLNKFKNWKKRKRKETLRIIKQSLTFDARYPKDQDYKLLATGIRVITKNYGHPEGNKFDLESELMAYCDFFRNVADTN